LKALALVITILCGSLLIYATVDFPAWGDPKSPASLHVSPYYLIHSVEETHVPNVVTSVLADYRGFDTMFETTVIFCAGIACFLLLRKVKRKKEYFIRHIPTGVIIHIKEPSKPPSGISKNIDEFEMIDPTWVPYDIITKTICKFLIPFIQLFALYVIAHGDFSPGGGFQGGVIFGTTFILLAISFNLQSSLQKIKEKIIGIMCALGVLIYSGIGALMMLLGGHFLDYGRLSLILPLDPVKARAYGMLGVEIGVGIAVSGVMFLIYANLASSGTYEEGL